MEALPDHPVMRRLVGSHDGHHAHPSRRLAGSRSPLTEMFSSAIDVGSDGARPSEREIQDERCHRGFSISARPM